ncbi:DUF4249 domain-containing protein [Chitinophaga nivalis]|uniref:DUF4249 domain-containing protein n=1 Tax=Chitinophaga nivalis TaxID=2991709 RepID=A0ABT3IQ99_9BACT|nr:DUF4249 domain-containing protein [Chitinophaga nivalis]MCW3464344.1 DUF4249 domain-containing protein [Chitinophaga nivalis]MCW3485965.1 DUF4249 domain-containing protein [Chitinophaga nivalis]
MKKSLFLLIFAAFAGLTACEDKIDLDIPKGISYPVLDAWITTETGIQKIKFTMSVPYTDNNPAPVINDATITLHDLTAGVSYPFPFKDNVYSYDASNKAIGVIGHAYKLQVTYKGESFVAYDSILRVPKIDSISVKFKTKEESVTGKEGYYATLHARDLAGGTDFYWIRSYRNDTLRRLQDAVAIDGSYEEGLFDGNAFSLGIADRITDYQKPFLKGETIIVRLSSVTRRSYEFLDQLQSQLNQGGLFAKILENVKTNIVNTTPNSKTKILGWFGTSAVSRSEKSLK